MNRSDLCKHLAANTSLTNADAAAALDAVISTIADALAAGETVTIAGFGKFSTKDGQHDTDATPHRGGRCRPRRSGAFLQGRKVPSPCAQPLACSRSRSNAPHQLRRERCGNGITSPSPRNGVHASQPRRSRDVYGMASNSRTATPTHSSGMLATEDCHIAGGTGRSGPEGISAIRPTREHPRLTSRTTFVVSTRRGEFRDPSLMRTHARSRAEIESPPRAGALYAPMRIAPGDTAAHGCARQILEPFPRRVWTPPRLQASRSIAKRYDCQRVSGLLVTPL